MFRKRLKAAAEYVDSTFYLGVLVLITALFQLMLGPSYHAEQSWFKRYYSKGDTECVRL